MRFFDMKVHFTEPAGTRLSKSGFLSGESHFGVHLVAVMFSMGVSAHFVAIDEKGDIDDRVLAVLIVHDFQLQSVAVERSVLNLHLLLFVRSGGPSDLVAVL